jgi:hypothetical protein
MKTDLQIYDISTLTVKMLTVKLQINIKIMFIVFNNRNQM